MSARLASAIHGRWRPGRLLLLSAAIPVVAAVLLVLTLSTGRATSGGDPYAVPEVVDTNPDPNVVETTIVADLTTVDIGNGVTAKAQTFNGTLPGPTFRLKVGDTVIVHFQNKLSQPTGIHWHGIELSNEMDGTPFTQNQVPTNGEFLYKFTVSRPGLFWYHPHHHASTNQVFRGLYGAIIVTDPNEAPLRASGVLPPLAQTFPIVLSDTTVCKGVNDPQTYNNATQPHVSGGAWGPQAPPVPKDLCETAPLNDEGNPGPAFNAGDIPNIQRFSGPGPPATGNGRTNEGQTVLTNGKNVGGRLGTPSAPGALALGASKLNVQSGQGLRLQLINSASIRYMRLRLTDATGSLVPLVRVGGEGGLIDSSVLEGNVLPIPPGTFDTGYTTGEILLPPGSRADVVASIPTGLPVNSVLTMWTEDYKRVGPGGTNYANIPTVPVMHLNVTGAAASTFTLNPGTALRAATGNPVETLPGPSGFLLNPVTFTPPKTGEAPPLELVKLTADVAAPNSLGVDGVFGTHDVTGDYSDALHLGSTRYVKEGETLQLQIENTTGASHPFHLHGFSIQPVSLTKPANPTYNWAYREFRDNVDIPAGYTLTFKIRIEPRPKPDGTTAGGALGRWVFHCHIFFHATNGMLGELVVVPNTAVPANVGKERPDVNVNGVQSTVNQGGTATMTGSFKDRDGGTVALTASKGTVTNTGGGNWSWTYPTGNDSSQFVYITGTDTTGGKGQMPFFLKINNSTPNLAVPGSQTAEQGSPLSFAITATDPDAIDPLTFSSNGLPAGLALKDNGNRSGTVSGTVSASPGNYNPSFSVSDGKNPLATSAVPIKVTPDTTTVATVLAKPEALDSKGRLTIGCRTSRISLRRCTAQALIANKVVGQATGTVAAVGARSVSVRIQLSKAARKSIAKSLGGVSVTIKAAAVRFELARDLSGSGKTTVVPAALAVLPSAPAFSTNGTSLTKGGKSFLKSLAKTVKTAKTVTCTGYPDTATRSSRRRALAAARASAACKALKSNKLKAKFKTAVAKKPAGSRKRPTRIKITIAR
jgi:FtsP/CotA-like multicopper oxidase with cupredoxin domain